MATNRNEPWAECEVLKLVECKAYEFTSLPKNPIDPWTMYDQRVPISDLVGKQFEFVIKLDDEQLIFIGLDCIYVMLHMQDCCESVRIDDICGDLQDLVGSPIRIAEELHSENILPKKSEWDESFTWTFYKLSTLKGYVDIKWYGTSNGYYSESVDLYRVSDDKFDETFKYYIEQIKKRANEQGR